MSDDFEKEMVRFAKALKQKASQDNTPLEEATNAFKALATFYAILKKHPSKEDGGEATTFEALQDEVHRVVEEEAHGTAETPVRSRPRRNGAAAAGDPPPPG